MASQNIAAVGPGPVPLGREKPGGQEFHHNPPGQDDAEEPREEPMADPGPKLGLIVDQIV